GGVGEAVGAQVHISDLALHIWRAEMDGVDDRQKEKISPPKEETTPAARRQPGDCHELIDPHRRQNVAVDDLLRRPGVQPVLDEGRGIRRASLVCHDLHDFAKAPRWEWLLTRDARVERTRCVTDDAEVDNGELFARVDRVREWRS